MFPRQSAEENGYAMALISFKGPFHRLFEVLNLHQPGFASEACLFGLQNRFNSSSVFRPSRNARFH